MDPARFDHLTRLLSRAGGRRALLSSVLGSVVALEGEARRKTRDRRDEDRDHDREGGGDARRRLQTEGRGKRRKHKKKKRRGSDDGGPTPPPAGCCGTETCPDPERGSTRAGCGFAGRSFASQDLNGSTFRRIDGRGANFNATNNQGSIFAEACLQGASFRRAKLGGSTWGGACLFDADFIGADLGGDLTLFDNARFCNTFMPDGLVNNRDCGAATPCCQAQPAPACQTSADCVQTPCIGGVCQGGTCVYTQVNNGPSPNDQCAVFCCGGECCPGNDPRTTCNPAGLCCAPNCAGKQCGPDGCGGAGTCGDCPDGLACNGDGQCVCTPLSCSHGCCDGANCRPGDTNQVCGAGGEPCAACPAGQSCQNQRCAACTPQCAGKPCGPDGCGGSCGACPDGQRCQNGACLCDAQSCPDGCCANGPGNPGACRSGSNRQACGTGGERCAACPAGQDCLGQRCAVCGPETCPDGCCAANGTCQPGDAFGACGGPGGGPCAACDDSQTCDNRQCVACGEFCTCTGQSVCVDEEAPNVNCAPGFCNCYVSQSGRPICGGNVTIIEPNGCSGDADCGPDGACIDSIGFVPGPCGGNGKPFCAFPCCIPECAGKACGPDGCGRSCGSCPGKLVCNASGQCVSACTPQTCPDGCCAADGSCQPGTAKAACGRGGAACLACGEAAVCLNQQCASCNPTTCQELGIACGPAPDGCDNTLLCGVCPLGNTPSCQDGRCHACSTVCSDLCDVCLQAPDGSTLCAGNAVTFCREAPSCRSDADCAGSQFTTCVASFVDRATGRSETYADACQNPDIVGLCVNVSPCCKPDCTGKVCGSDGCIGSCGECGECERCESGTCQVLQANGTPCNQDSECCSDNCLAGVCTTRVTQCPVGPCNPPARGCVDGYCCSCPSLDDCCAGQCCAAGGECCAGQCCAAAGDCCNGQCCTSDQFCCDGVTCCFNSDVCQNGSCNPG